ncbi:MAG: PRC-barrel domain-containing protein [Anaerolineae bacterium]|nr:PRC-barrel domain-containing protein [Anaerolineae bacterium]
MGVDLDIGAEVWASDGELVGTIEGVVLDPYLDEATDVVVSRGALVPQRRVVPVHYVGQVRDHRVELTITASEVERQPELDERDFIPLDRPGPEAVGPSVPAHTWTRYPRVALPPIVTWGSARRPHLEQAWRNLPATTAVLREGLPVRARDGEEVGRVDELLADPKTGLVTHIVVRRGRTHAGDKAIPIAWVERSDEDSGVTLAVDRRAVDELADYH